MERHPAYYEKYNKTTGGPDMKMLKKLAALPFVKSKCTKKQK